MIKDPTINNYGKLTIKTKFLLNLIYPERFSMIVNKNTNGVTIVS